MAASLSPLLLGAFTGAWAASLARQLCAPPTVSFSALALPRERGIQSCRLGSARLRAIA